MPYKSSTSRTRSYTKTSNGVRRTRTYSSKGIRNTTSFLSGPLSKKRITTSYASDGSSRRTESQRINNETVRTTSSYSPPKFKNKKPKAPKATKSDPFKTTRSSKKSTRSRKAENTAFDYSHIEFGDSNAAGVFLICFVFFTLFLIALAIK